MRWVALTCAATLLIVAVAAFAFTHGHLGEDAVPQAAGSQALHLKARSRVSPLLDDLFVLLGDRREVARAIESVLN